MREPETVKLLADLGTTDNTRYRPGTPSWLQSKQSIGKVNAAPSPRI
jgi:hypothetical protein